MQALIDELEQLVQTATKMPLGGKLLMDETTLRRLIQNMRAAAPDDLRAGQRISGDRDRILSDARAQARRIIEEAQEQANVRVDEQSVVQTARQRAREMQHEAEKAAHHLRTEADQYVMNQFAALEARLVRVLREVQAGQRALSQAIEPGSTDRENTGRSS
jgi:vacuolar-type H+-ATPase subunit H